MHRSAWTFLPTLAFVLALAPSTRAQFSNPEPPATPVHDAAALRPPAGAHVAIIEFEDLECPGCARTNPLLREAVEKYRIPWRRHDFPQPFHAWSFEAAVDARWLDTHSQRPGSSFRDALYSAQPTIRSEQDLHAFALDFARRHKWSFPSAIDPQGNLAQLVKADYELGQRIGIQHTPTIWVVTERASGSPFVEVIDRSRLFYTHRGSPGPNGPGAALRSHLGWKCRSGVAESLASLLCARP
jgi:protein-disulfide isomerase